MPVIPLLPVILPIPAVALVILSPAKELACDLFCEELYTFKMLLASFPQKAPAGPPSAIHPRVCHKPASIEPL